MKFQHAINYWVEPLRNANKFSVIHGTHTTLHVEISILGRVPNTDSQFLGILGISEQTINSGNFLGNKIVSMIY